MTYTRYQDIRLSKHFVLLDFIYGMPVYRSKVRFPVQVAITEENIRNGRHLCQELLELCIAGFGPCSVSFGIVPEPLAGNTMPEYRPRPHKWVDRFGAACDVCWHEQCAQDTAPIDLCHAIDRADLAYERLITYGGSEFMCMATMNVTDPNYKLYENVRTGPGTFKFTTRGKTYKDYRLRRVCKCPEHTTNWMREPGEKTHAFPLDTPHHHRVGRYFMLSDFCRNEAGVANGNMFVAKPGSHAALVAGMFAQVLDPLVAEVGRISVTHGGWWPIPAKEYQLAFLLPQGASMPILYEHADKVVAVEHKTDHPSGAWSVRLTIKHF